MKRTGFSKCTSVILALCIILSCISFSFANVGAATNANAVSADKKSDDGFSWDNATVYFLLTDRFKNGNTSNDHSYNRGLDQNGNVVSGVDSRATFHGGDFAGVTQTIEEGYFNDLGVNAIWISAPYEQIHGYIVGNSSNPSFAHYSYHGYYVLDYTQTDANFGTAEEFEKLVDTAHKHGLRVILDVVMNHAGYNSIYDMDEYGFGTVKSGWESAYSSHNNVNNSTYHSFIDYNSSAADWAKWWGPEWIRCGVAGYTEGGGDDITRCLEGLPDFKTGSQDTVGIPTMLKNKWTKEGRLSEEESKLNSYFQKTGKKRTVANTLSYWLSTWVREYGVDGFRCDTAKHVELSAWNELKTTCVDALKEWRVNNPEKAGASWDEDFWMTGEAWDHNVGYGYDGYFTQGGFDSMINFETQGAGLLSSGRIKDVYNGYANSINTNDKFNALSYISSHDSTLARGDMLQIGSAFLLLPGGVQIYYGDETNRPLVSGIPFDGSGGAGHSLRSDMNWSSMDKTVLEHWQKVGKFRNNHVSVGAGSNTDLTSSSGYAFSRSYSKNGVADKVAAVINASSNTSVTVDVSAIWADGQSLVNAYDQSSAVVSGGKVTFNSGANGTILIEEPDGRPLMTVEGAQSFKGEQTVTVKLENCDSAKCSIDGGNKFVVENGTKFSIGSTAYDGDKVEITLEAENENGSAKSVFSFLKQGTTAPIVPEDKATVRVKSYDGSAPYLYVWTGANTELNGSWPGKQLTAKDSDGYYVLELNTADTYNVIVNKGSNAGQTDDITGLTGDVTITITNAGCTAYKLEQNVAPESGMALLKKEAREVKAMTASDYTSASWNTLSALMPAVDALIAQESDADENEITAKTEQLQSAKSKLKLASPKLAYAVKGKSEIKGTAAQGADVTVNVGGKSYKTTSDDITGAFTVNATSLTASSVIKLTAERKSITSDVYTYNMASGNVTGEITPPVSTKLTVNAKSNIFPSASQTFDKSEGKLTVSYKLTANMGVESAQWVLSYDSSKLRFTEANNTANGESSITPAVGDSLISNSSGNALKGVFTSLKLFSFKDNADFVTVTFDIIGTGSTEVNLDLEILTLGYKGSDGKVKDAAIVNYGKRQNISGVAGFEKASISTATEFVSELKLGDVTGNGVIDVIDVTLLQKYLAGLETLSAAQLKAADCDLNGDISIKDATLIQKIIAGFIK